MYVLDTGPYFKRSFQENEPLGRALEFEHTTLKLDLCDKNNLQIN